MLKFVTRLFALFSLPPDTMLLVAGVSDSDADVRMELATTTDLDNLVRSAALEERIANEEP